MTTSAHELGLTDRQEITDLYARYSHAFDDGQAEECAALFTEDGAFTRDGAEPVRGRAALAGLVRAAARTPGTRHLVSGILVEPAPDGATETAYVQVLRIEAAAVRLVAIGRYRDEFVRDTEGWRIRSRRFTAFTGPALTETVLAAVLDAG